MNKKSVIKITALIIVSAILVTGVALTICGGVYAVNKEDLSILVFLDAAGADDKFVSRLAEFIDDNQEVLDAFVSGDIVISDSEFCQFAVDIAGLFGSLNNEALADAVYNYLHGEVKFQDIGLIGKYSSLIKNKRVFDKLEQFDDSSLKAVLNKCRNLSYEHCKVISAQFVQLCNYIYLNGNVKLSAVINAAVRAMQSQDDILEHVSLRDIVSSIKYLSHALAQCKQLNVTFDALNIIFESKAFEILSRSPNVINCAINFVDVIEVDVAADIISYTFAPNVAVALLQSFDNLGIISDGNITLLSDEMNYIFAQLAIDVVEFDSFYNFVNQKNSDGAYILQPQNLSQIQKEYICDFINPIEEYIKSFVKAS